VTESSSTANRQIARAAGTILFAFVISNFAGLLRQVLIANAFGTGTEMEAFNAANRVAETLFNLVAGGALSSAFIPTFAALLVKGENRERAWRLASNIGNSVLVITIVTGGLAAVFAPWIVRNILAPGFSVDPYKEQLTITLMRLMLPSAVIFGISGLVMGVLNSNQIFLLPALAPAMYQVGMIFGVLALAPSMGIYGLAWGVVLGAGLHLGLQAPALLRLGGRYTPAFGLDSPDVREVLRLMGPRLLGVAVVQLNFWINVRLASQFVEGSVTGVVLAFTLMLMPQAAIAQSIAIAALPTFSTQVAQNRLDEMQRSLAASLRGALLLSLPASIGLILLRKPIIITLYQRGQFDERSTELVAWALLWFAAGLVGHALVEILSRAFYAMHDTRTPVLIGILAMSLNVLFSYTFTWLFARIGWLAHGGLALANSTATGLEAVALLYLMRKRLGGIEGRFIIEGTLKAAAATVIMAAALMGWRVVASPARVWVDALGGIMIGGGVFAAAALGLRISEFHSAASYLKKRLVG